VTGSASDDETGVDTGADVSVPAAGVEDIVAEDVVVEDVVADDARVRLTITTARVSDTEVAAITVALLAATSGAPAGAAPAGPPAWRHAGMLEGATDRRVRTPAELRHPA
jgi:hypothetical protein